jgi:hypothetical protein
VIGSFGMRSWMSRWALMMTVAAAAALALFPAGAGSLAVAAAPPGGASRPAAAGYGEAGSVNRQALAGSGAASGSVGASGGSVGAASGSVGASGGSVGAASGSVSAADSPGYWAVASDGGVYGFGGLYQGQLRGQHLNKPIVAMAATTDGGGYWLVGSDGGIFAFGDAGFYGSEGGQHLNKPIVGMAATADGEGYWLVASDGGIFAFGDAGFYGSEGGQHLNKPIVGMAATADGEGYWLVASDGGMFGFGDAGFYGSEGSQYLNKPIVGMAATTDSGGYRLVASDGGIFAFGDAQFYGSEGAEHLNKPIVAVGSTSTGHGYWLVASDGGVFTFGDAPFLGSTGSDPGPAPIVGVATTGHAYVTGYDISWPQCSSSRSSATVALPRATNVSVVGATDGYIGAVPNPCLNAEALWAGPLLQTYLVADPISATNGPLSDSTSGPKTCPTVADTTDCGYNWGWNNALQSVALVRAHDLSPTVWWLDVETDEGWNPADTAVSAQIVKGMIDALHSEGLVAGIYCTQYQWHYIAGEYLIPGIPVWIAGAGNLYTGTYSALNFCTESYFDFAGGTPWLVQFGYTGSGYTGPASRFDQDYSCPR